MGGVLSRVSVVVGLETTAGTYATPSEVIKVGEMVLPNAEMDAVEDTNFSFYGGMNDTIVIADWAKGTFDIPMSLYKSLSYYTTLFAICNLKKTAITTPFAGFSFTPETHATSTASIDLVMPDRKFKYQGAKASFKLAGKVGDKVTATFSINGSFVERLIAAQTIVDTPRDEVMIVRRLGGMSINGVEINLSEFEFDMGSTINQQKFTNVGEFFLADYAPKLTLKTRLENAGADGFTELLSGEAMEFVCDLKDTEGNIVWRFVVPNAKMSKQPDYEDSDGIFVISREYNAVSTNGDDNFTLYHFTH
ncbi:MAG TPA: hypothetical protein CFH80_03940 [Sulfurospirillum cavolei]|uniref:Phage tail protein n=1 Tax=Sulfurospirillum cavolei TaxID=366522 RepID=A0A2D3W9N7_9BACT|nr:MAG TPA: hypothetical protein CFH80_03940 [Sulfurospirillum cavolei]